MAMSSTLKRIITSPTLNIERKNLEASEERNICNIILISNNDAIQDSEGRRYFILDVSTKYVGNKKYFDMLHSNFTYEVGQLFYSYLIDVDLTNYDAQAFPMTQSKLDSFSNRLDNVYKFIKDKYVLPKEDIQRISVQNFYDKYICYCTENEYKKKGKIEFNKLLSDVGINKYKSHECYAYKVNYSILKKISDKFHWVHELDVVDKRHKKCIIDIQCLMDEDQESDDEEESKPRIKTEDYSDDEEEDEDYYELPDYYCLLLKDIEEEEDDDDYSYDKYMCYLPEEEEDEDDEEEIIEPKPKKQEEEKDPIIYRFDEVKKLKVQIVDDEQLEDGDELF
jgi:hypothetical protein